MSSRAFTRAPFEELTDRCFCTLRSPPSVCISNATCQSFAEAGCLVFASARRISAMENLPDSVQRLQLDVGDLESCKAAVKAVIDKAGRVDILVSFPKSDLVAEADSYR